VDVVVLVDPRDDLQSKAFGIDQILAFKAAHPTTKILHRVNECSRRNGNEAMDPMLANANRHADFTVFISEWLRDYHAARWFDRSRPHACIYNGADPGVFHPIGAARWNEQRPLRLVTHHWSDNPLKGFDDYEEIDRLIADGALPETELWVIGRWPAGIRWRAAKTFPPTHGRKLADLLRQCHVYLTASRWEPCGMHHVEGAQCGLPLLYHEEGGGIVEAGRKYGVAFRDGGLPQALRTIREQYGELRRRLLLARPSGDRMCVEYAEIVTRLVAE
jgi:glycosyltransferase involved in cell wall biosynthesis